MYFESKTGRLRFLRANRIKKSYKLILQYRSIDNLPDKFNITVLNHVRCRELFTISDSQTEAGDDLIIDLSSEALATSRSTLTMYSVDFVLDDLLSLYNLMPEVKSRGYTMPPSLGSVTFVIE